MKLNPQEHALITLIRNLRFGTIEMIAVVDGKPTQVKGVSTRIDLTKEPEREAIFAQVDPATFLARATPKQTP